MDAGGVWLDTSGASASSSSRNRVPPTRGASLLSGKKDPKAHRGYSAALNFYSDLDKAPLPSPKPAPVFEFNADQVEPYNSPTRKPRSRSLTATSSSSSSNDSSQLSNTNASSLDPPVHSNKKSNSIAVPSSNTKEASTFGAGMWRDLTSLTTREGLTSWGLLPKGATAPTATTTPATSTTPTMTAPNTPTIDKAQSQSLTAVPTAASKDNKSTHADLKRTTSAPSSAVVVSDSQEDELDAALRELRQEADNTNDDDVLMDTSDTPMGEASADTASSSSDVGGLSDAQLLLAFDRRLSRAQRLELEMAELKQKYQEACNVSEQLMVKLGKEKEKVETLNESVRGLTKQNARLTEQLQHIKHQVTTANNMGVRVPAVAATKPQTGSRMW